MDIESCCDERLWTAVSKSYDGRNYTAVILEAIQYLGDVIRDKAGLSSDGMSLIGEAFGGSKPKLRVNRFETETDKNIQGGIEHLVRGLYKAFRNPRSHEKITDSPDDANTVLMLVTYLLKVIGQAKSQFERTSFIQRVFDTEFVESDRYASLLAAEVPAKYHFDVLVDIFHDRRAGKVEKLKHMVHALWNLLSDEVKDEFAAVASVDLNTIDKSDLIPVIRLLPHDFWSRCSEAARIRTENLLISSIKVGAYDASQKKCLNGTLGTWSTPLMHGALLKNEFHSAAAGLLNSKDREAIDYVFKYILRGLYQAFDAPHYTLKHALLDGLNRGDVKFKEAMEFIDEKEFDDENFLEKEDFMYVKWRAAFAKAVVEFVGQEQDDIPF